MGKHVYYLQTQLQCFKYCNYYIYSDFDRFYYFLSQEIVLIKTLGLQNIQDTVFSGSLIQCLRNYLSHCIGRQCFYIKERNNSQV